MAEIEKSKSQLTIAILTKQGESLAYFFGEDLTAHGLGKVIIIAEKQTKKLLSKGLKFIREYGTISLLRFLKKRLKSKKVLAAAGNITYRIVDDLNGPETENLLIAYSVDLCVLANTGIIKKNIIELPRLGIIMAHTGLLPKYRGINCSGWALLNGDDIGVSTLLIDDGIDTGPILLREALDKNKIFSRENLREKMLSLRIELVRKSVQGLRDETLSPIEQKNDEGTLYTLKMLTSEIRRQIDERLKALIRRNLAQRA